MIRFIGNNSRGKVYVGNIAGAVVYIGVVQHGCTTELNMTPEEAKELAEDLV